MVQKFFSPSLPKCRKALIVTACLPDSVWPSGLQGKPQNTKQVKSVVTSTAGSHPGRILTQSLILYLPRAGDSGMVFSAFLASLAHQSSCSGWVGEVNSVWQTHMSCLYWHPNSHQDPHEINLKHFIGPWPQPATGEDLLSGFAKGTVSTRASRQLVHIAVHLLLAEARAYLALLTPVPFS